MRWCSLAGGAYFGPTSVLVHYIHVSWKRMHIGLMFNDGDKHEPFAML